MPEPTKPEPTKPEPTRPDDDKPDYAHADEADGMIGTPNGGSVGNTPRGWASYGASRHLPGGKAERHRKEP